MRAGRAQKSLDTSRRAGYNIQVSDSPLACGFSSSGRASASQAEGGEFEPRNPLHSQRQDICSGAFLFGGFTMLPPRGSVVRPLCHGCFGEWVTSSDGCGQNRHEKTTVRRHRGDPSRFKAALFFRRGNFFGRELPEFDRLSFPSFLPFQPGTFTPAVSARYVHLQRTLATRGNPAFVRSAFNIARECRFRSAPSPSVVDNYKEVYYIEIIARPEVRFWMRCGLLGRRIQNKKSLCKHREKFWSWKRDLNTRPADYESAALPTELFQRIGF